MVTDSRLYRGGSEGSGGRNSDLDKALSEIQLIESLLGEEEKKSLPENTVHLTLGRVMDLIPAQFKQQEAGVQIRQKSIAITVDDLFSRLAKGKITVSVAQLVFSVPADLVTPSAYDATDTEVVLPLPEIVAAVDPQLLEKHTTQSFRRYNIAAMADPFASTKPPAVEVAAPAAESAAVPAAAEETAAPSPSTPAAAEVQTVVPAVQTPAVVPEPEAVPVAAEVPATLPVAGPPVPEVVVPAAPTPPLVSTFVAPSVEAAEVPAVPVETPAVAARADENVSAPVEQVVPAIPMAEEPPQPPSPPADAIPVAAESVTIPGNEAIEPVEVALSAPAGTVSELPESEVEPEQMERLGGVNLNTAFEEQLLTLDGVSPAMARNIVAYRAANGPFKSIFHLCRVPGLGRKTFKYITGMPWSDKHLHRKRRLAALVGISSKEVGHLPTVAQALARKLNFAGCVISDQDGLVLAGNSAGDEGESFGAIVPRLIGQVRETVKALQVGELGSVSMCFGDRMFTVAVSGGVYLTCIHQSNKLTMGQLALFNKVAVELAWLLSHRGYVGRST